MSKHTACDEKICKNSSDVCLLSVKYPLTREIHTYLATAPDMN